MRMTPSNPTSIPHPLECSCSISSVVSHQTIISKRCTNFQNKIRAKNVCILFSLWSGGCGDRIFAEPKKKKKLQLSMFIHLCRTPFQCMIMSYDVTRPVKTCWQTLKSAPWVSVAHVWNMLHQICTCGHPLMPWLDTHKDVHTKHVQCNFGALKVLVHWLPGWNTNYERLPIMIFFDDLGNVIRTRAHVERKQIVWITVAGRATVSLALSWCMSESKVLTTDGVKHLSAGLLLIPCVLSMQYDWLQLLPYICVLFVSVLCKVTLCKFTTNAMAEFTV